MQFSDRNAEYFHGPDFQISLRRRRSIEEKFQEAREGVDFVDVPTVKDSQGYVIPIYK